jgi:fumarate reductase flavoprotein subunit
MNVTPRQPAAEYDLVIAGAGAAGMMAAIAAAEAGGRIAIFEKLADVSSSSTAIAVGRVSFCGTEIQRASGVADSPELMTEDLLRTGLYQNDRALVDAFMRHQHETWLFLQSLGVKWSPTVNAVAGMSVPRGHLTDPMALVRLLERHARQLGVEFFFGCAADALLTGEDGSVTGLSIIRSGQDSPQKVMSRSGVILAMGGFARAPEQLERIAPRLAWVKATSGRGHTGDALRMTAGLGALTRDMEHVQPSFEQHIDGSTSAEILLLYYRGGIIVNSQGDRFIDESNSYKDIARACLDQPERMGFQIFDQPIFDRAVEEGRRAGQASPMSLDDHRIALLQTGESVAALATACGIPPDRLTATIASYNSDIRAGRDRQFSRRHLGGTFGQPVALDTPPFYAYATVGHLLATYAGLAVDPCMNVLTAQGPIRGLYAAGEAIGGFHGASYQSGTAIAKALVFGRLAGQSAIGKRVN